VSGDFTNDYILCNPQAIGFCELTFVAVLLDAKFEKMVDCLSNIREIQLGLGFLGPAVKFGFNEDHSRLAALPLLLIPEFLLVHF
jgi:hypothetical protein